jgi:hypothetical protein
MKGESTLTPGLITALSAMVLIGAGIEFPISQACAQQPKSPEVSFAEDIAPILKGRGASCHQPGGHERA